MLVAGSTLLTLVGLEIALRIAAPAAEPAPPAPHVTDDLPVIRTLYEHSRPNVRGRLPNGVPYRTNRFGIRGPDITLDKPPGTFRIAVIGDSVTMGAGVADEDTYARRIERRLNARGDGRHYEVVNLGMPGLNARVVVARFEEKGLPLAPDLVIYGYTLNDIEGPAYRPGPPPDTFYGVPTWLAPAFHSRLFTLLALRVYSLREAISPPKGSYVRALDDNYFHNPAALAQVETAFDRLAAVARARRLCVLLVPHTYVALLRLHPFVRHYELIERLGRARGFYVQQTFDRFRGRDPASLWVSFNDVHPNARGHALLADAVWEGLMRLPASCWRDHPVSADGASARPAASGSRR